MMGRCAEPCGEGVCGGRVRGGEGGWLTDVEGGCEGRGEGERDGKNGKGGGEGVSGEWLDLTTELTT